MGLLSDLPVAWWTVVSTVWGSWNVTSFKTWGFQWHPVGCGWKVLIETGYFWITFLQKWHCVVKYFNSIWLCIFPTPSPISNKRVLHSDEDIWCWVYWQCTILVLVCDHIHNWEEPSNGGVSLQFRNDMNTFTILPFSQWVPGQHVDSLDLKLMIPLHESGTAMEHDVFQRLCYLEDCCISMGNCKLMQDPPRPP